MAKAQIKKINGVPTIFIDGEPLPPMAFTIEKAFHNGKRLINAEYYSRLAKSGIKLYFICTNTDWAAPGSIDGCCEEIEAILKASADARFIIRIGLHPPLEWVKDNPSEVVQYSDGIPHPTRSFVWGTEPYPGVYSLCSDKWCRDAGEALAETYRVLMEKPYADKIIGFFFSAGGTSEWYYRNPLTYNAKTRYEDTGGFDPSGGHDYDDCYGDLSPAFKREFSRYLKEKYGTSENLRLAWRDPDADVENPEIPGIEKRYYVDDVDYDVDHMQHPPYGHDKDKLPENGTNIGHFVDIEKNLDVFDFYRAWHLGTANSVIYFGNLIKEISNGEMLTGVFYGAGGSIHFFNYSQLGGVRKILESNAIDFISSPGVYENRQPGGFTGERQVTDSILLHNKILFAEDDERTHKEGSYLRGYFEVYNMEDTANILKRTLGRNISQNTYGWWFDQHAGGGRYLDEDIYSLLDKQQRIIEDCYHSTERQKCSEIAFIYDEESYHVISSECNHQNIELFRNYEIDRIGAPSDRYFHNDMSDPRMPDYKLYVFMNTLYLSDAEREKIKAKLRKNNATALFMYGSGIINPDRETPFSVENMTDLTGIETQMNLDAVRGKFKFADRENVFNEGLDRYDVFGDFKRKMWANTADYMNREKNSRVVLYPELYADDKLSDNIAYICETGHPAITVKELEGYKSIYCASRYLSSDVMRGIAKYAGCHIYLETDDVLYASKDYVTVHASYTGERVIKLPRKAFAYEVYEDKYYSQNSETVRCYLKLGETKTFKLL